MHAVTLDLIKRYDKREFDLIKKLFQIRIIFDVPGHCSCDCCNGKKLCGTFLKLGRAVIFDYLVKQR